jgi:RNA polymerase sigma-70 factor (ECF subfamily)
MRIEREELRRLVERSRKGDADAFATLVEAFERPVYALALQKLGHPEDAQDVAQDAFLEAFRTLERLEEPEAFPGWIRRIAMSFSFQRLRRRQRHPETAAGAGAGSPLEGVIGPAARNGDIDPRELPNLILRAVSRVPEAYQLPLMLRYLEQMTPQQIADELAMNASTVRVTLHRGSILLRRHLDDVLKERES